MNTPEERIAAKVRWWRENMDCERALWDEIGIIAARRLMFDLGMGGFVYPWPGVVYTMNGVQVEMVR